MPGINGVKCARGRCRRQGRRERAHRALEIAARFPRAPTALSSGDDFKNGQKTPCLRTARTYAILVREDDESMKPPSNVKTPAQYIASLPADRAKTIATVRALVNKHIPRGYDECLVWGTIGWTIPLSRYPDTYNKQPICYVALSSQKNYCSLYLMGAFWSASQLEQLKAAFKAAGKKLDMGKCCVHFESPDDLPLEAIGKLISAISSEKWIEMYEQSRLMTKAGQAQMAKQGAPSASKVAAKRVDTKRRR